MIAANPDMARHPNGPLAVLRRTSPRRAANGRARTGPCPKPSATRLDERKRIGRTSSQDPGVTRGLDLIVATASLEVGFNDPGVGCVLQHKAPREAAQFLQRKGRAGRPRGMRPWTLVVLSDYGRDRLAYQGYEQLFDPELRPRHLPFASRYIQRMQATYTRCSTSSPRNSGHNLEWRSVWTTLADPVDKTKRNAASGRKDASRPSSTYCARLLDDPQALADLSDDAGRGPSALRFEEVQALLWEYPRPHSHGRHPNRIETTQQQLVRTETTGQQTSPSATIRCPSSCRPPCSATSICPKCR